MTISVLNERDGSLRDVPNFNNEFQRVMHKGKFEYVCAQSRSAPCIVVPCDQSCSCKSSKNGRQTVILEVCSNKLSPILRDEINKRNRREMTGNSLINENVQRETKNQMVLTLEEKLDKLGKLNMALMEEQKTISQRLLQMREDRDYYKSKMDELRRQVITSLVSLKEKKKFGTNVFKNHLPGFKRENSDMVQLLGIFLKMAFSKKEQNTQNRKKSLSKEILNMLIGLTDSDQDMMNHHEIRECEDDSISSQIEDGEQDELMSFHGRFDTFSKNTGANAIKSAIKEFDTLSISSLLEDSEQDELMSFHGRFGNFSKSVTNNVTKDYNTGRISFQLKDGEQDELTSFQNELDENSNNANNNSEINYCDNGSIPFPQKDDEQDKLNSFQGNLNEHSYNDNNGEIKDSLEDNEQDKSVNSQSSFGEYCNNHNREMCNTEIISSELEDETQDETTSSQSSLDEYSNNANKRSNSAFNSSDVNTSNTVFEDAWIHNKEQRYQGRTWLNLNKVIKSHVDRSNGVYDEGWMGNQSQ